MQRRDRPGQRFQKVHFQDFPDRGGDGATKNHFMATVVETARVQNFGPNFGDFRGTQRDSCPDFPDSNSWRD